MTTRLGYHSILGWSVLLLLACGDLPDFPEADRPIEPTAREALPGHAAERISRDAALAGWQAGGVSGLGVLVLSGARW